MSYHLTACRHHLLECIMRDPINYGYFISATFVTSLNCTVLLCLYHCCLYSLSFPFHVVSLSHSSFYSLSLLLFRSTEISRGKGKAIPVQAWTGPEGSRRLRLPDYMTLGMNVVRLSAPCTSHLYPPGNIPSTHFC